MKRLLLLILTITIGGAMASSLPKYYTKRLKNGLEIVAVPMKNGSNVISVDIFYKVGSRNETMGKSGIAHMLEHLNFKSTKNLKAGEFDEIVKRFGGVDNASTGFDFTHYFIKCSSGNLKKALGLFGELMENLSLKEEEFLPERDVVAEERRWRTDNNPLGYLYFRLFNNAYVYHPYHWTPIGFMSDILSWKIEDIKKFHKTYYQPKNAILIVAGDIEQDRVFKEAAEIFSHIKNSKTKIPSLHQKEPPQDGEKRVTIYKQSEVEILAIAYHIPNFEHPDQVALSVISSILSDGKSSWLYKELIDKKKMVNQIYAYNMELADPGLFLFIAVCNPSVKAIDVEKEIQKQIKKLKTKGISSRELKKVKINTKADFIFSLENSSNVSELFGSYFARGNIKPLLHYEENLDKLTPQDIKEVAKKYFQTKNSITVILKNQKEER
jgi:predicted Zn-dependent peptidase